MSVWWSLRLPVIAHWSESVSKLFLIDFKLNFKCNINFLLILLYFRFILIVDTLFWPLFLSWLCAHFCVRTFCLDCASVSWLHHSFLSFSHVGASHLRKPVVLRSMAPCLFLIVMCSSVNNNNNNNFLVKSLLDFAAVLDAVLLLSPVGALRLYICGRASFPSALDIFLFRLVLPFAWCQRMVFLFSFESLFMRWAIAERWVCLSVLIVSGVSPPLQHFIRILQYSSHGYL